MNDPTEASQPRAPWGAASLIFVCLLCGGAVVTPVAMFLTGFQIGGPVPGEEQAELGRELLEKDQFGPALDALQEALTLGYDDNYVQLNLARCFEGLGRLEEADAALDVAIGDGHWWPPYIEKARFLRRRDGVDAACAWLAGLEEDPSDHKFPYLQAEFRHFSIGDREGAVSFYEEAVRRASARHGFRFDEDGWLLLDEATLQKENNDYAALWPTLEYLARCRLELADARGALRTATMGVAIGQQLRRCQGHYDARETEAGDLACRILRARAMVRLGQLDEAERELEKAKPLAARSSNDGPDSGLATARLELEEARGR